MVLLATISSLKDTKPVKIKQCTILCLLVVLDDYIHVPST